MHFATHTIQKIEVSEIACYCVRTWIAYRTPIQLTAKVFLFSPGITHGHFFFVFLFFSSICTHSIYVSFFFISIHYVSWFCFIVMNVLLITSSLLVSPFNLIRTEQMKEKEEEEKEVRPSQTHYIVSDSV